jgi:predicted dehydrogenase
MFLKYLDGKCQFNARDENMGLTRRKFLNKAAIGTTAVLDLSAIGKTGDKVIQGFDDTQSNTDTTKVWEKKYDRKVRVGIVGYGFCKFGAAFGFQDHPNVEIVAVSDLIPDRCAGLARDCRCSKTYPSLEELVKDDRIEAVFVATDAPSHAKHVIEVLRHGKHVACAVPAVFGSLEDADRLLAAVKKSGLNYMMFETAAYHNDLYAMRQIYDAGGFGDLIYSEGEYYHYGSKGLPSYKGWRRGLPPQWYPTHSNAYHIAVGGGSFTEVSCIGKPSILERMKPSNNIYKNPFGTEVALFRTNQGGMARMAVSFDTPGHHGDVGRIRGTKGSFDGTFQGLTENLPEVKKPPLPPTLGVGGHGGTHGYLTNEFITSILGNHKPLVNIEWALNMTVPGIVAHKSAMKGGEWLKIPQFVM